MINITSILGQLIQSSYSFISGMPWKEKGVYIIVHWQNGDECWMRASFFLVSIFVPKTNHTHIFHIPDRHIRYIFMLMSKFIQTYIYIHTHKHILTLMMTHKHVHVDTNKNFHVQTIILSITLTISCPCLHIS